MADDNTQLLIRMHAGDEHAARGVYQRFGPRLAAAASLLVRDTTLGQDIAQDVFLRVLRCSQSELTAVRDANAWLMTIARHLAHNAIRAQSRHAAAVHRASHAPLPDSSRACSLDNETLRIALDHLLDADRELIILKHVAALTFDQIADLFSEPRSTVATRYRTALLRLRATMTTSEVAVQ